MIIIKPKVNIIPLISAITAITCLFAFPEYSLQGARDGIEICTASVIPSLFPFMALSTFIMCTDALYLPCKLLGKLTEFLFCLPENTGQIIFMALTGGYPIGAKITSDALINGDITENEAKRLSVFCINSGPAFTITALGAGIYGNVKIGIIIYASLCASNIILGILTRFFSDGKVNAPKRKTLKSASTDDITFAVWDSFTCTLKICAWVIIFTSFFACIKAKLGFAGEIASAIAEVTAGTITVSKMCSVPVVTALCGFGGFCVHCQVLKYLKICGLPYRIFFAGRLLASAISAVICYLILYFFPIDINVAYTFSQAHISAVSVSLPAVITFIFMCFSMIFGIDRKRKVC